MKIWFITGCSSGLGEGIAKAVLKSGDAAVVTARDRKRVSHFEDEYPDRALAVSLDLADKAAMKKGVRDAFEKFGRIDVLVNNAGRGYRAAVEESEPEQVRRLFEEDFFSPMEIIQMVLPRMRENHQGLIINVSSIGAVRGALGNGYYSAAKAALELATEALAKEVEPFGIRAMIIEPGAMRTGFYGDRMGGTGTYISAYDGIAARYRKEKIDDRHDQPGDPEKCGEIIVQTAFAENAPFRLLLGTDAVTAAEEALDNRIQELRRWKPVSIKADYS
ncbi:MAG: SDR family NAD(P)-dependent oxidoreductase [Oscillospiraceae bacterium]|jgi:NAD(P)-dependent dehydrogenase (short-subunit alcohol dehydrogenase family)